MIEIIKKNFDDLYIVELEHKYIHFDCFLVTAVIGIIFSLIVGPLLEPYDPNSGIITLIAFSFSFSSLFWAWRIAVYIRRSFKDITN